MLRGRTGSSGGLAAGEQQRRRSRGGEMVVLGGLCGVLGMLLGFTFGHMHGVHSQTQPCIHTQQLSSGSTTTTVGGDRSASSTPCKSAEVWKGEMEVLAARVARVEAAAPRDQTTTGENVRRSETLPCAEIAEHATELQSEVDELSAKVRELSSEDEETGGVDLGKTAWKKVSGRPREALWKKTIGSFPYSGGSSTSREALLFEKRGECEEIDVVVASNKPGVCLAVFDSRLPLYTMIRTDATDGARLLQAERKKVSPKKFTGLDTEAYASNSKRLEGRSVTLMQTDTLPKMFALKESLKTTAMTAAKTPDLLQSVQTLIRTKRIAKYHNTVVVMCTNSGTLDLIANFACSCRSSSMRKLLQSVLVFAADPYSAAAVDAMGLASFNDPALGDLPDAAAKHYGDFTFVRMMWLKVTSVYLVVGNNHNALFQDADVVWLRDPVAYFADPATADPETDTFWMDDGARSLRFTPFFANSGFYFLRANDRVIFFMHRLLLAYDTILAVRSHQHALISLLIDHVARYGLTLQILPPDLFPQGQVFHHKKRLMQQIVDSEVPSLVFHMCWTESRTDKLKYLKRIGLWFLTPQCDLDAYDAAKAHFSSSSSSKIPDSLSLDACCSGVQPFHAPTPFTDAITISSK